MLLYKSLRIYFVFCIYLLYNTNLDVIMPSTNALIDISNVFQDKDILEQVNQNSRFTECFCRLIYALNLADDHYKNQLLNHYIKKLYDIFFDVCKEKTNAYKKTAQGEKKFKLYIKNSVEKAQLNTEFSQQYALSVLARYAIVGRSGRAKASFLQFFNNDFASFGQNFSEQDAFYQEMLLNSIKSVLDETKIDFLGSFAAQILNYQNYFTIKLFPIAVLFAALNVLLLKALSHYLGSFVQPLFYLIFTPVVLLATNHFYARTINQVKALKDTISFAVEEKNEQYVMVVRLKSIEPARTLTQKNFIAHPISNQLTTQTADLATGKAILQQNKQLSISRKKERQDKTGKATFFFPKEASNERLEASTSMLTIADCVFYPVELANGKIFYVHLHEEIQSSMQSNEAQSVIKYLETGARVIGNLQPGSGFKFHKGSPIYYHLKVKGPVSDMRFIALPISIPGYTEKTWIIDRSYLKKQNTNSSLELDNINYHTKLTPGEIRDFINKLTPAQNCWQHQSI